jgi:hypothetical protein
MSGGRLQSGEPLRQSMDDRFTKWLVHPLGGASDPRLSKHGEDAIVRIGGSKTGESWIRGIARLGLLRAKTSKWHQK